MTLRATPFFALILLIGSVTQAQESPALQQVEAMRTVTETIQRISDTAKDPTTSSIAAVMAATDMLKPQGPDRAIDFLNQMLNQARDPAVKRAIRFQLADQLKAAGHQDQALEQYRLIITGG